MCPRDASTEAGIWPPRQGQPFTEMFHEGMISDLPAPVRRYFLHAIAPGTPLARSVRLEMTGTFRLARGVPWFLMSAQEIVTVPDGFFWQARLGRGLFFLRGADHYAGGAARMRCWLWGILPVLNRKGPDIDRSCRGRLAAEAIWLPSSLLPQGGVRWEPIDDTSARAIIPISGFPQPVTFFFEPDGRVGSIRLSRWGNRTEDGRFAELPFGCQVVAERTFGGHTIPSDINASWWGGTDRAFEFFRATVHRAEFA